MKKIFSTLLLASAIAPSAFADEIPNNILCLNADNSLVVSAAEMLVDGQTSNVVEVRGEKSSQVTIFAKKLTGDKFVVVDASKKDVPGAGETVSCFDVRTLRL